MSERLKPAESEEPLVEETEEAGEGAWATGDHYSRMTPETGSIGSAFYMSLPTFTVLTKTQEELEALSGEFYALLSKYTEQIIVGDPHEASLILSINQAASDLAVQNDVIEFLREKIHELTGSYDAAGQWGKKE